MRRTRIRRFGASCFLSCLILAAAASYAAAVSAAGRTEPVPCDIRRGACTAELDGGMTLQFDIQPRPVETMSELTFMVTLLRNGREITDASVALDLSMPGMYMGKNSPVLRHVAHGRYEGKGLIPRCMSGSKTWQADLLVVHGRQKGSASFVIEVP